MMAPGLTAAAAAWLEGSALGVAARRSHWLYPLASVVHILGVALLLGAIAAFDLRVMGVARAVPLRAAAGLLLPVAAGGLALQLLSGLPMLAADATHLAANPAYRVKLVVVAAGLANLALFHLLAGRGLHRLGGDPA